MRHPWTGCLSHVHHYGLPLDDGLCWRGQSKSVGVIWATGFWFCGLVPCSLINSLACLLSTCALWPGAIVTVCIDWAYLLLAVVCNAQNAVTSHQGV
jgi:hypothetical protein